MPARMHAGRLLLVIHHLAVDGVSWRILLPDLEGRLDGDCAWRDVRRCRRPARRSGAGRRSLRPTRKRPERLAELPLWTGMQEAPVLSLFDGALDRARDLTGTARELTLTLPAAVTGALLTRLPAAFHAGVNDVLLTGLALAVMDWCRRHGRGVAIRARCWWTSRVTAARRCAAEPRPVAHGRLVHQPLPGAARSGRTRCPRSRSISTMRWRAALRWAVRSRRIKEQLRALPDHGLGYGLLRYLNPQTAPRLCSSCPVPQIGFNYLGRFAAPGSADWASAPEAVPLGGGDPALALAHAIEVNALTLDGADGPSLSATWTWAPALLSEDMVRDLAQGWFRALDGAGAACRAAGCGRPHAERSAAGAADARARSTQLERQYPRIDDILPLAPLQEGLLFHALYDAQAPDVYTIQLDLALAGALDADALAQAARALMRRHANLRAGFRHAGRGRPVQVIVPDAEPRWRQHRSVRAGRGRATQRLDEIAHARSAPSASTSPRRRSSALRWSGSPPASTGSSSPAITSCWTAGRCRCWCANCSRSMRTSSGPKPNIPMPMMVARPRRCRAPTPYRDYLAWIAAQDRAAATTAWREALAGLEEPTYLAPRERTRAASRARADRSGH